MAIIDLGTFHSNNFLYRMRMVKTYVSVNYDTVLKKISWTQVSKYADTGEVVRVNPVTNAIDSGGNRGYAQGQVYQVSCDGYTKLSFAASNSAPWVTLKEVVNSTDCGFIEQPPVPTPLPPPPVCDLEVTAESIGITALDKTDGQISVEISTTQSGNYTVNVFKQGTNDIIANIVVSDSEPSYLFQNIPAGAYTVKANSNEYDCVSETDIIVPDFSFNEIYHFLFCEKRFGEREIRISFKKRGYTGESTLIPNGSANLVEISYPEKGNDMKFKPIIGSECTIKIVMEELSSLDGLDNIYTDQEKQYRLDLIFEDDQELIWSGYVLPEQSNFPFKSKPYVISYEATDGIKTLEDIDFDITEGRLTFLQGIKYCLDKTDLRLGFKTLIDIEEVSQGFVKILNEFTVNQFGDDLVISEVEYEIDGVQYSASRTITVTPITAGQIRRAVIYGNTNGILFYAAAGGVNPTYPVVPANAVLVASFEQFGADINVKKADIFNDDSLYLNTFDTKRFIKEDGAFTDCFTVLEYICKQFTAQLKQADGYWVIENIGAKGRDNLLESAYNNDLSVIYGNERIELLSGLDCDSEGRVLSGAYIRNGSGHKKSIVSWKLGYPQPVITNFNFEKWVDDAGALVPYGWQMSQPIFGQRGNKINRLYDPTTGVEISESNGTYYFRAFPYNDSSRTFPERELKSSPIAVFTQEIIEVSFQFIGNAQGGIFAYFMLQLGNLYCSNLKGMNGINQDGSLNITEPVWQTQRRPFMIEISEARVGNLDPVQNVYVPKFPAYGEDTNINFSLPKAPIQAYFTLSIFKQAQIGFGRPDASDARNLGFDNFRIKKSSPITGATIKDETIIEVNNTKIFSTIPEAHEVYFGDVDNVFRTDGIKDLNNNATQSWRRKGISESDGINNIVARELLSQYQNTFRILEGEVLASDISIRSIFNLPGYELYRFATLSGAYDLLNCRAKITIAEVYAEEGESSGPIGGGGNEQPPNPIDFGVLVLGFKNNIFTDGNDNIFQVNGD